MAGAAAYPSSSTPRSILPASRSSAPRRKVTPPSGGAGSTCSSSATPACASAARRPPPLRPRKRSWHDQEEGAAEAPAGGDGERLRLDRRSRPRPVEGRLREEAD